MKFDHIVITAANAAQANGYRAQVKGRANVHVIADPGGRRVGSLGATVNLLQKLKLDGRVLVCHSGGDARRTPGYAAMGKAFIPLQDGRSLFDHIVASMEKVPLPKKGGLLIVSGDVLLTFDATATRFNRPGVTGVAYPDGPFQASRHGVYVESNGVVTEFLQKPQVTDGTHLVDTGILFIDWATAEKMKRLPIAGDIYDEFPKMLLAGFAPFHVNVMPQCEFFHIGSSRELLARLGDGKTYVNAAHCKLKLAGENIVTNIPAGRFDSLSLKKGECLTCLPLGRDEWYDLHYHIDDNFKTDGLWEKYDLAAKMKRVNHARLLAVRAEPTISVKAPVRIDFAGGWSDTPPICNHEGGTVLNVAVTLDGRRPIEVILKPRKDKLIRIVSKDLGKQRLIKSAAEIADHSDPHDWCALAKSALTVTGFEFGTRGFDLIMSADLPKGSGMGTSSILGAATIAAILGRVDAAEVGELTLRLEQEMRTGGGWQDQFGGLLGGVKLLTSKPGEQQNIHVQMLYEKPLVKVLSERGLLYFTGQKRMARNILRKVLSFYKENPHDFAKILVKSLKADAVRAAKALSSGDMVGFATAVNGYWRDKKLLDPGSTNERVEDIIATIRPWAEAVTLTGAGGGGFMFILAKSAADAAKIRTTLEKNPPSQYSRFYDFAIDVEGLTLDYL